MRQDYKTLTDLSLAEKKNYLLGLHYQREEQFGIYECMTHKDLMVFMSDKQHHYDFFIAGLKALYNSNNYNDLEYHLMMMNCFFNNQKYLDVKKELSQKLCKKTMTINEYCVLRHLISFQHIPFVDLIDKLHQHYDVDDEECARICLLENQHHLAYEYLKKLDDCQDEILLDLLRSYSLYEYASLMRHYAKKKKGYSLIPTH